jgi:hypothetical protein
VRGNVLMQCRVWCISTPGSLPLHGIDHDAGLRTGLACRQR